MGLLSALVPRYPGITSALGCIIADIRHDEVATVNLMLDGMDITALTRRMVESGNAAHAVVAGASLNVTGIDVVYELDMHYLGQTHTVSVPLPATLRDGAVALTVEDVRAAFEAAYSRAFSRLLPGIPVKIVNLRTAAIGRRPAFDLKALAPKSDKSIQEARTGSRKVWFDGGWQDTAIYARLDLPVGAEVAGPAILEQLDTTIVVDPGLKARVDDFGNLIVERAS